MAIFIIGIILLTYGYLCRLLSIYFFWDSKHFGWIAMAGWLLSFLIDLRKSLSAQKRNIFWISLPVTAIILMLGIYGGAMLVIKSSKPYEEATALFKDGQLKNEIGELRGFGFFPSGFDIPAIVFNTKPGPASFVITVRGSIAHRDVEVILEKSNGINWGLSTVNPIHY